MMMMMMMMIMVMEAVLRDFEIYINISLLRATHFLTHVAIVCCHKALVKFPPDVTAEW
jgi:hypothetical protein